MSSRAIYLAKSTISSGYLLHRQFIFREGGLINKLRYFIFDKKKRSLNSHSVFRRHSSSSSFQLDALPFSVSPDVAFSSFERWLTEDQGVPQSLITEVKIEAAYVPVWSFDLYVRFDGNVPEPLASAFHPRTDVMYLPGLSGYAGYFYRPSLIQPVHSTSLLYLASSPNKSENPILPFSSYMLRPMVRASTGQSIPVNADPWTASPKVCLSAIRDQLQQLVNDDANIDNSRPNLQVISMKRVYLPTFVFQYKLGFWRNSGISYQAFVSGCDAGSVVSGVSHSVLPSFLDSNNLKLSPQILSPIFQTSHRVLRGDFGTPLQLFFVQMVSNVLNVAIRIIPRKIPIIGAISTLFIGFRKFIQPWMDQSIATAKWERERMNQKQDSEQHVTNDFVINNDRPKRFFDNNYKRILDHLGPDQSHQQGSYDWYHDWEKWARQEWEQQQRKQQQSQRQQQQQQQQQQSRKRTTNKQKYKKDFEWDFDVNDPYSVLNIRKNSTKKEISQAFRREMLKHHPDTQPDATPTEKIRLEERSKYITEAYRKLKNIHK